MEQYDPMDLSYIAGIIDGEGCIGITTSPPKGPRRISPSFRLYCAVQMSDPNVPYFLYHTFGGGIYTYPPRVRGYKPVTHWRVWGKLAVEVCTEVLPYLKIKKKQAELVIEFNERVQSPIRGWTVLPSEEITERLSYVHEIQLLNKRGA